MGIEQRKTPRYVYRAELEILTTRPATNELASAVNLSRGGLCFEHPQKLSSRDKIRIRFPQSDRLEVQAEVRYATRVSTEIGGVDTGAVWVVGAEFSMVDDAQQRGLDAVIARLVAATAARDSSDEDGDE
jgi:hypothetical protein